MPYLGRARRFKGGPDRLRQTVTGQNTPNVSHHGWILLDVEFLLPGKAPANGTQFIDHRHVFHGSIPNECAGVSIASDTSVASSDLLEAHAP
jgi:hypothetical protein